MKINKSKGVHCGFNNFMRTRYFPGMLMTDREFEDEQRYQNDRRKLLNRMLHGWGVVCGLKVRASKPQSSSVIVEPGMALDCWGNEILVCSEQTIDLSSKPCSSNEVAEQVPCAEYLPVEPDNKNLYVVIKYQERGTKPEPVYATGGSCEEKTCEFSRTQEGFCIDVINYLPNMPHLETLESGNACTDPFPCPSMNCCADPHYIVLATISCEQRFDFISKWITGETSSTPPDEKRIWYRVERDMDKVCIMPGDTKESIINVTDIYTFETKYGFINGKLIFQLDKLDGLTFHEEPKTETPINSQPYIASYQVKASAINSGTGKIKIPITLTYQDLSSDMITWESSENEYLTSEIVIGTADVCQGSIIFDAMIRNMEQRKYVPGFQWLAWFLTGREEGELPLTGVVDYCIPRSLEQVEAPPSFDIYTMQNTIDEMQKNIKDIKNKIDKGKNLKKK